MARKPNGGLEIVSDDDLGNFDPANLAAELGGDGSHGNDGGPGNGDDFDPSIHIDRNRRNADGSYRRKRGRKPGGTNAGSKRGKASSSLDITGVQAVLFSIHAGIAGATRQEIWNLADSEAKAMAQAIVALEKEYPTKIDPRALAWFNLMGVAGAVYGTRFMALMMEARARRHAKSAVAGPGPSPPKPADVVQPSEGFVREATSYQHVPPGLVDTDELQRAMDQINGSKP